MKRRLLTGGLVAAGLVGSVMVVCAQVPVGGGYGGYGGYYGGGYGYNTAGAGSTPAGSYLTGMGNAIRAQGEYNVNTSQAAINLEDAAKKDIENRQLWTNTYFEMRKINDAYKQSQKGPPPTSESWVRLAHVTAPKRLPSSALDPLTGTITWPATLRGNEFKNERDALDRLYGERAAKQGAIGINAHKDIRTAIDKMTARLKSHVQDLDSKTYTDSKNFLASLAYESDLPIATF